MRFTLLLSLLLCIFCSVDINASSIEKDSLNPLYPDLVNAYQLKIQNLEVIRSLGKSVKLKYDVVNTGKHIVKLGKGKRIPDAMRIVFDNAIESTKMSGYKAQIAEQILQQDLFIQSGKSATQKEVKVNLNAPAKLAHLIGSGNGSRLSDNTLNKIKEGVGSLGGRQGIDRDMDMDEMDIDAEMEDLNDFAEVNEMDEGIEIEEEVPAFSKYTEKVTDINTSTSSTRTNKRTKRVTKTVKKKVQTEVVADDLLDIEFEKEDFGKEVKTMELPDDSKNARSIGKNKMRNSTTEINPNDDSILASFKKRKAKREAAKKEAMDMKASAAGSEVYDDMEVEVERRELSAEELDTSENLETERAKWYEGFKPYAAAGDFEENQTNTYTPDPDADEFLDRTSCPDLTLNDLQVVKMGKKWATVEFMITNVGKGPARIYGTTPKEADNVYIKAFLSGSKKVSRGATTLGGMYVNKGVSNKAGKLMPDESMKLQMKIDIRKKTKFTSVLILDLDAFGNCRECDETNNKQHVVLK